jgi:CTP synthase (UTP-ammonia lyase)
MSRIAVIGDFDPTHETHTAIAVAVGHSDHLRGREPSKLQWVATPECETMRDADFAEYDGLWIAPGSPYQSLDGALKAIQFARTHGVALLGTCAGFQHVVLEYARNVMGFEDANHAEYDPYASRLFVTPLSCSLRGQSLHVTLTAGTTAADAYRAPTAVERYYCNFGMNLEYLDDIVNAGLAVSGVDTDGEPRIVELPAHRFFVATLFVPQTSSTPATPHPIIDAFLNAANAAGERAR